MRTKNAIRTLGAVLLPVSSLLVATQAVAQRTEFKPEITLTESYTDDVDYIDSGEDDSDTSTRLGIRLPVTRGLKKGEMSFSYRTAYTKYADRDELDNDGHRLGFRISTTPDRVSGLTFTANYTLTQDRDVVDFLDDVEPPIDPDANLTQRTERTSIGARLAYRRQLGERWTWNGLVETRHTTFKSIESITPNMGELTVQDRTTNRVGLGIGRILSRRTTIGATYRYALTDLDAGAEEDSHIYAFTLRRTLSERATLGFRVGGYNRSQDRPAGAPAVELDDNGIYASLILGYERPLGPVRFGADASVEPSDGGSLEGTSTMTTAGLSVRRNNPRLWNWVLATRYARRTATIVSDPTLESWGQRFLSEWNVMAKLGVRLSATHWDQSGDPGAPTGAFYRVSAGLTWRPLARTRLGGE